MNRETQIVCNLLETELDWMVKNKPQKKDQFYISTLDQLVDRYHNVELDASFNYSSLSIHQWDLITNFHKQLEELQKRIREGSIGLPEQQITASFKINFDNLFGFKLDESIDKSIADIIALQSKIAIYREAIDNLDTLIPSTADAETNRVLTDNVDTFNELIVVLETQQQMINHLFQHVV